MRNTTVNLGPLLVTLAVVFTTYFAAALAMPAMPGPILVFRQRAADPLAIRNFIQESADKAAAARNSKDKPGPLQDKSD